MNEGFPACALTPSCDEVPMNTRLLPLLASVSLVCWAVPTLAQTQRPARVSLGLAVEPTPGDADRAGVIVRRANPDGPAAKAGVQNGDVIVKIGDKDVKDYEDLVNALARHKPGDQLTLQVIR